jgi:hypothetical protein
VNRYFWRWATLFTIAFLALSIAIDLQKKMWLDELYTLHMARQANPTEIVAATLEGVDVVPPLYGIIVHYILPLARNEALAVRLPSTIGYAGMLLCLLVFCRRRLSASYSWIAMLFACIAGRQYATEGRAYGLEWGFAAAALLCWQSASAGKRRTAAVPLLALSLCLMVALHYYAIFFVAALAIGELARSRTSGKFDFAVIGAIASAAVVLAIHYPLIAASRRYILHFWSPAAWQILPNFYWTYFGPMALVCLVPVIIWIARARKPGNSSRSRSKLPLHEWAALASLSLMPIAVMAISMSTTHLFVERYVLWAVIGFAPLAGAVLEETLQPYTTVGGLILSVTLGLTVLLNVALLMEPRYLRNAEPIYRAIQTVSDSSEPIVIPSDHIFMELSYYAPPKIRDRLIFPLSRELDLKYKNADTGYLAMSALWKRSSLPMAAYESLLAEHRQFLLAVTPRDYLAKHLAAVGYRVVPKPSAYPVLFEVTASR